MSSVIKVSPNGSKISTNPLGSISVTGFTQNAGLYAHCWYPASVYSARSEDVALSYRPEPFAL
eukprot:1547105-Rhodomonas_salina.2